jgi:hypothetical protein
MLGVVVVVVAAGAFFMTRPSAPQTSDTPRMTEQMQNRTTMRHSMREFLSMTGESLKCAFVNEDATVRTEATTYVAGGKIRSDSIMTRISDGTVSKSSSIIDDDMMYAWGSDMPQGMKMSLSAMQSMSANSQNGNESMGNRAADYDRQQEYSCEPWSVDASYFALPADIQFTDYSEMMQGMSGMMQGAGGDMMKQGGTDAGMMDGEMMMDHSNMPMGGTGGGSNAMMCAACEQAPDAESKAQCKAALQCE